MKIRIRLLEQVEGTMTVFVGYFESWISKEQGAVGSV